MLASLFVFVVIYDENNDFHEKDYVLFIFFVISSLFTTKTTFLGYGRGRPLGTSVLRYICRRRDIDLPRGRPRSSPRNFVLDICRHQNARFPHAGEGGGGGGIWLEPVQYVSQASVRTKRSTHKREPPDEATHQHQRSGAGRGKASTSGGET